MKNFSGRLFIRSSIKPAFIFFAALLCLLPFNVSQARDVVTDWYIKDFTSTFELNTDSTMTVTEMIAADCDGLPGKHGIFRILPTQIRTPEGNIPTPVELVSITDFNDNPVMYSQYKDGYDHTVTWKIGDPDVTVTGENYYKIVYKYKNVIRTENPDFDEFYWNLNGNFWDIETDRFTGTIVFPEGVTEADSEIYYYTGKLGSKDTSLAGYEWTGENELTFESTGTLKTEEGITASVAFPKNIFTPYEFSFWEKYGWIFIYVIALLFPFGGMITFIIFWLKYGKEIKINKTKMPEYHVPENLSPMASSMLMTSGAWKINNISAGVVSLATKGMITIKEVEGSLFKGKDFELSRVADDAAVAKLDMSEQKLFNSIFATGRDVKLKEIARAFSSKRDEIRVKTIEQLIDQGLMTAEGYRMSKVFAVAGNIMAFLAILIPWAITFFFVGAEDIASSPVLPVTIFGSFFSGAFIMIMAKFMNKRSEKGAETAWHLNNFKMFMTTAEIDRQKFFEQENIFEKYLPYAMVFGIVKKWVKRIKELYGEEYFERYTPVWYSGTRFTSFSSDSFTSAMNSLSSSISTNIGSSSGSGGSGGSGGGGGGGGGGGW